MTTIDDQDSAAASVIEQSRALEAAGEWEAAIDLLTEADRATPDTALTIRLVQLRHSAFAQLDTDPLDEAWPYPVSDLFADREPGTLPEVAADVLTADLLASALEHHGSLIVRGLLGAGLAESLLADTKRAFEASAASADGAPVEETAPWFRPFEPDEGYNFGFFEQYAARAGGGVLLAESPRPLRRVIEAYREVGLGDVLAEYLGEWPALSVKKSTLRKASPDSARGWHQDGKFLGERIHTVNVWTALTPCGIEAPSVDVFSMPFDHIVETGTDGADHPWSVSRDEAAKYATDTIVRPVFEPGDALLFNQLTLHESGIGPEMTKDRYAIEAWFFGPSSYPIEQVPILF